MQAYRENPGTKVVQTVDAASYDEVALTLANTHASTDNPKALTDDPGVRAIMIRKAKLAVGRNKAPTNILTMEQRFSWLLNFTDPRRPPYGILLGTSICLCGKITRCDIPCMMSAITRMTGVSSGDVCWITR